MKANAEGYNLFLAGIPDGIPGRCSYFQPPSEIRFAGVFSSDREAMYSLPRDSHHPRRPNSLVSILGPRHEYEDNGGGKDW
jgi:hypothetical protein